MAYGATVLKVMIASPSDVEKERRLAREVIHEWNSINSEDRSLVLMPITWETHSSPSMEGRAQEIINKQILKGSDLLIAVFWTRIGTPTGEFESGTVEEINEHIADGKPTMIYFSSAPVIPQSIDQVQYARLNEFRGSLLDKGLVETYQSLAEFREKLARQLAQTVIREFTNGKEINADTGTALETSPRPPISDDATELLVTAVQEGNGTIMSLRSVAGLSVQSGNKQFVEKSNPRSEARWIRALEELMQLDYIRDRGYKEEIFEVTANGYEAADAIILGS